MLPLISRDHQPQEHSLLRIVLQRSASRILMNERYHASLVSPRRVVPGLSLGHPSNPEADLAEASAGAQEATRARPLHPRRALRALASLVLTGNSSRPAGLLRQPRVATLAADLSLLSRTRKTAITVLTSTPRILGSADVAAQEELREVLQESLPELTQEEQPELFQGRDHPLARRDSFSRMKRKHSPPKDNALAREAA